MQIVAAQIAHQVAVIHRAWQVMEERYAAIIAGEAQETRLRTFGAVHRRVRGFPRQPSQLVLDDQRQGRSHQASDVAGGRINRP